MKTKLIKWILSLMNIEVIPYSACENGHVEIKYTLEFKPAATVK
jgi:hypothetical protein